MKYATRKILRLRLILYRLVKFIFVLFLLDNLNYVNPPLFFRLSIPFPFNIISSCLHMNTSLNDCYFMFWIPFDVNLLTLPENIFGISDDDEVSLCLRKEEEFTAYFYQGLKKSNGRPPPLDHSLCCWAASLICLITNPSRLCN